jgi:putative spermidine/putrescine transport system permease protein
MVGLFVIPLGLLFMVSLWEFEPGGAFAATSPTFENYARYLESPYYRQVVVRTLRQGFLTASICLLLGYPFAYVIARGNLSFRYHLLFLLFVPLFVSVVVRNFGWIVLLDRKGLINYALLTLGLVDEPVRILDTAQAVLIGLVNVLLVFMVMPIYSVLVNIPRSYEDAAQTMGATPITAWTRVTLPLSLPGIVGGWVLVFALSISSYVSPSVLGGPVYAVMPVVLVQQIRGTLNWPFAAATGFILIVIGLLAMSLPVRILRQVVWFEGS